MLSYQKLIEEWPNLLMRPDAIEYLHAGLDKAKVRRQSAILEVQHFLEQCQQNHFIFYFFDTKSSRLEQLCKKYLAVLKEEVDVNFTEDEVKLLMSDAFPELSSLIEKHALLTFSNNGCVSTYARAWR